MNLNVPDSFLSDVASSTTSMMASVSKPVELIIGILLAFLIVEMIIGIFRTPQPIDASTAPTYDE